MSNSKELIAIVKEICDQLRSKMEVTEYRDYIMAFLFYKYLSEQSEKNLEKFKIRTGGIKYSEFNENNEESKKIVEMIFKKRDGFFIWYIYSFQNIVNMINQGKPIIDTLEESFIQIENINSDSKDESKNFFKDLFKNVDFSNKNLGNIDEEKEKQFNSLLRK